MFFVIRSAIVVLLICFALDWRIGGPAPRRSEDQQSAGNAARGPKMGASPASRAIDAGLSAATAGAEAMARKAREKCALAPADCLALARRLGAPDAR